MHRKLLIITRLNLQTKVWLTTRQKQELGPSGKGVPPRTVRQVEMARRSITGLRDSDQGASRDQWGVGPITSWVTRGGNASQTKYPAAWRHEGGAVGARGGSEGRKTASDMRVLAEHQLHWIHLFIWQLLFSGPRQMKRRHQGELETKARRNPCNSSETWHRLWLQQTGNTDESRKCSRKCKWTCSSLFSGPQIRSAWKSGFQSNNLDPSITPNIHPQCQDLSVSHQANARAMREMTSNAKRSFLLPLFGGGRVGVSLIPRLVFIVNCSRKFSEEKWRCAEFVVSLLSSGNRSGLLV